MVGFFNRKEFLESKEKKKGEEEKLQKQRKLMRAMSGRKMLLF